MKAFLLVFLAFYLVGCDDGTVQQNTSATTEPQVSITSVTPSQEAQDATFQDLQGNPVELSDYEGQRIFLNYWATWCAPCIEEIPSINRAQEVLEPEGFVFLLASDESVDDIREFVNENDFGGNFIKLNTFFGAHGVQAMPSTVLYDEQGAMVNSWLGAYEWDSPEMLSELRQ